MRTPGAIAQQFGDDVAPVSDKKKPINRCALKTPTSGDTESVIIRTSGGRRSQGAVPVISRRESPGKR